MAEQEDKVEIVSSDIEVVHAANEDEPKAKFGQGLCHPQCHCHFPGMFLRFFSEAGEVRYEGAFSDILG